MKTFLLVVNLVVVGTTTALSVPISTGTVLKTETGDCQGQNNTFRTKYWVDLDNDNKADYSVTVWCNGNTATKKVDIMSGEWPNDYSAWHSDLDYHFVSQSGVDHYGFTYRLNSNNTAFGTELADSTAPTNCVVSFYSMMMQKSEIVDRDAQAPKGSLAFEQTTESQPNVVKLTFESYEAGSYTIAVKLANEDGASFDRRFTVILDSEGVVTVPFVAPTGSTVEAFVVSRPDGKQHDSFQAR